MKIDQSVLRETLPRSDVTLLGLEWVNEEKDLRIKLQPGAQDETIRHLLCEWVTHLSIQLDFGDDRMGAPFTWDIEYTALSKQRWRVEFDFAGTPRGRIHFECNHLEIG